MTLGALLPEPVLVRVGMATYTSLEWHSFEFLEFFTVPGGYFVAFFAGDLPVTSGQPEF